MAIQFRCPQCQTTHTLPNAARGKQFQCPKCGKAVYAGSPVGPGVMPAVTRNAVATTKGEQGTEPLAPSTAARPDKEARPTTASLSPKTKWIILLALTLFFFLLGGLVIAAGVVAYVGKDFFLGRSRASSDAGDKVASTSTSSALPEGGSVSNYEKSSTGQSDSSAIVNSASGSVRDAEIPFEEIDRHALAAPKEAEESVATLVQYLTAPVKTDTGKARAFYRWVTDRISYNWEGFRTNKYGDNSVNTVLKTRLCVCAGYANLYLALCKEGNVEACKIDGVAKGGLGTGPSVPNSHVWNAVKLDGKWCLVDATWGAGGIKDDQFVKRFNNFYFLVPPEWLMLTHFPTNPEWFLVDPAPTCSEYDQFPAANWLFFEYGIAPADLRHVKDLVKADLRPFDKKITIRAAPLQMHLKEGVAQHFCVACAEAKTIALIYTEIPGQQPMLLEHTGDTFELAAFVPSQKGTMRLMMSLDGNHYQSIFNYMVE
jgi:hypothetical protein